MIGAGLGGWLAADLATIEPGRVAALVLAGALGIRAGQPGPDLFLRRWAGLLPWARVEIIDEAGHLPFDEQPGASLRALSALPEER